MKEHIRVLVVEDNEPSRALLRALLEFGGYEVSEASCLAEAREVLARQQPQLLLLDVQLPDGDGTTLLAEVRADPRLATLPVVAVTALAMPADRDRLLAAGFNQCFTKPIDTRGFRAAIDALLEPGGRRS